MNKLTQAIALSGVTFFAGLGPVLAATTGSVGITASILQVVDLVVTATDNTFNITAGTAVTDQAIATLSINSNDPIGYSVSLTGTNLTSVLENTAGDESIAYTVTYNGTFITGITTEGVLAEDVLTQTNGVETRSLTLTIPPEASTGRSAEAFTDTITVAIIAK